MVFAFGWFWDECCPYFTVRELPVGATKTVQHNAASDHLTQWIQHNASRYRLTALSAGLVQVYMVLNTRAREAIASWCCSLRRNLNEFTGGSDGEFAGGCESPVLAAMLSFQRGVLVTIYHATNGPEWSSTKQDGWLSASLGGEPMSSVRGWRGVGTSAWGEITSLSLERNADLQGVLPDDLGLLDQLQVFNAFSTKLEGCLPGCAMARLAKLRCLRLNNTLISGPIPALMCRGLTSLRELWLNDTYIEGTIPSEVGMLQSLEILDLSASELRPKMALSGRIPASLGGLKQLKKLWLQRTNITGPLPPSLAQLHQLTHLYAFETRLSGEIPCSFGDLSSLMYLHLSNTSVCGPVPARLGLLVKLEELILSGTRVSGKIPREVCQLTNLKRLGLAHTALTGPIPNQIGSMWGLRHLSLNDTSISGPLPTSLPQLTMLQELNLSHSRVAGLQLAFFGGYSSSALNALAKQGCAIVL